MSQSSSPSSSSSKKREEYKHLTDAQYSSLILRRTDAPYSSNLPFEKKGLYACANCSNPLFTADSHFPSGTGWPSFKKAVSDESVKEKTDWRLKEGGSWVWSGGVKPRTEAVCGKCGGHLGHVFKEEWEDSNVKEKDKGSEDSQSTGTSGKRICVNGSGLKYIGQEG